MEDKKKIKMKLSVLIIIIVLGLMFVIGFYRYKVSQSIDYKKSYNGTIISQRDKNILAEKAYINYAWGFQYRGKAIFSDGSIYEWDILGSTEDTEYKYNANIEEQVDWILKNGICINKKVSEKDLEDIKENINLVKDNIQIKWEGDDMGANYIDIWNTNKDKIRLRESGDGSGENKSIVSQKLIKIIDKYLK